MFQYIHGVNAKVEEGRRYLTDVVKLELTDTGSAYKVTVHPAVQDGTETITTVPVHPKTVGESKEVPTYTVPAQLKVLVRADVNDIKHETAGENQRNWVEATIPVSPIVDVEFPKADYSLDTAIEFYNELAHQLAQGDDIRNLNRPGVVGSPYDNYNSRYPGF